LPKSAKAKNNIWSSFDMTDSFRLPYFMLFSLFFIGFDANSTAFPRGEIVSEESEGQPRWQTPPCLIMLAQEFQRNKDQGISYKITHRGGKKGLKDIAEDEEAKSLDDEGLKWKKACHHEPHIWSSDLCRGVKALSHNPFYLSFADLYVFYRVKDQLTEGSPLTDLWEDLFLDE